MKTFEVEAAALGGGGSEWAPSTRELLRLVREIDSETLKELETNIAHLRKGELTAAKQRLTDFMGKSPEAWHGKVPPRPGGAALG